MSDEKKRRFDPSLLNGVPAKSSPEAMRVVGQLLGGVGAGLGQGIAQKMNERLTLAAAALQGLLSDTDYDWNTKEIANWAVDYADAVLARLEEKPDPRFEKARASIGVAP